MKNQLLIHHPHVLAVALAAALNVAHAADPVVQTKFTADPAPFVHDGVVYLYTGHDEDDAPPGMAKFRMMDWQCYTSTDMVNWTDHGTVASLKTFPWADQRNDAWAAHCIERNGKFYLYAPVSAKGWPKNVIAVAVADSPIGPYKDAIGKPLVGPVDGFIDPTAFIDDDGQAYLYWGNPRVWYVKLNKDMISYTGEIMEDPQLFKVRNAEDPFHYQEGPWAYKRGDHYYMAYASTCCPEGIGYAMGDSPTGPWEFKGYIMKPDRRSSGNHPGIIEYKGKSYIFGFNYKINFTQAKEHHERRSVCVAEMKYNPDGTIQELPWWEEAENVTQLEEIDPYKRVEGETICWSEGMKSEPAGEKGMCVYPARKGAFFKVKGVDFSHGARFFHASVASEKDGGEIEVHLDSPTGSLVGACKVPNTGGARKWKTVTCPAIGVIGVKDLYFVFVGGDDPAMKFDWWKFE